MTEAEWQEIQRQAQRDIIAMFALPPELITPERDLNRMEDAAPPRPRQQQVKPARPARRKKGKKKNA